MTSLRRELLVVADASPLILLAKIGRLPLLNALAEEIWVPSAV
jgi:predicted nucleic acid-binding protein